MLRGQKAVFFVPYTLSLKTSEHGRSVIHRLSPVRTSARGVSCQLPQKASSPQVSSQGQGRLLSVFSKHLEEVMQLLFTAHVFVNLDLASNNQKQQEDKGLSQKKTVNGI